MTDLMMSFVCQADRNSLARRRKENSDQPILPTTLICPATNRALPPDYNPDEPNPCFTCVICNNRINNGLMALQHLSGKNHTVATMKHRKKNDGNAGYGKYPPYPPRAGQKRNFVQTAASPQKNLRCNICDMEMRSVFQYNEHFSCASHKFKESQMKNRTSLLRSSGGFVTSRPTGGFVTSRPTGGLPSRPTGVLPPRPAGGLPSRPTGRFVTPRPTSGVVPPMVANGNAPQNNTYPSWNSAGYPGQFAYRGNFPAW